MTLFWLVTTVILIPVVIYCLKISYDFACTKALLDELYYNSLLKSPKATPTPKDKEVIG